jgi:hypothetical protein
VLDLSAPVDCEPFSDSLPLQPPEATHEVALVEVQVSVVPFPLETVLGPAARVTVGAGAVTETVADWLAVPPGPVQVSTKVLLVLRAPVPALPLIGSLPDHAPEAVQAVAWVVDQVRLELPPLVTELGLAPSVTVGAGAGELTVTVADCVAVPPAPVQVRM